MHAEVVALRREVRALKGYAALLTAGLTVFHPSPLGVYREGATRARLAVAGVAAPTLRVWGADGRIMREVLTP